ncbi:MAG: frr [Gammaproteobacteria bacterium]|jgi:ribosome recycling factor|nr:frr [Gammaproteobacteria bacterium]
MIENIKKESEQRMQKSIKSLQDELAKLRTGRAHASLLDHIHVESYGSVVSLSHVASITIADSRTLLVTPWDKAMVSPVEKAIRTSDLGLNPATMGQAIRVPLPALTEERRKDLTKVVKAEGENAKVAVRNIRRDAMQHLKDLLKDKAIGEDDERRAEEGIQKLTDKYIAEVDKVIMTKETELMAI